MAMTRSWIQKGAIVMSGIDVHSGAWSDAFRIVSIEQADGAVRLALERVEMPDSFPALNAEGKERAFRAISALGLRIVGLRWVT